MDDLLPEFVAETRETLQAVAGALVAWEAAPSDRALLDQIFRFVHTVKGSCGFLDLPRLQRLSHAAEDALAQARSGTRHPDAPFVSAVLGVIDRIGELADAIETGQSVPDDGEQRLIAALTSPHAPVAPTRPLGLRGAARPASRSVRLPVELLDRMMGSVSDMVLARNELARDFIDDGVATASGAAFDRLSLCVRELREAVTRARMARIDTLFAALPRLVRDLSGDLGKQLALEVDGGDVELDREMIEMIRDPLTHVVRNAIDHGVERPEARRLAGKPPTGRLVIGARQSGNRIQITIEDDGAGIDPDRVAERALAAGLVSPAELAGMSPARRLDFIFAPGLSTAATITEISGRGVGMDIVRANVERLGGTVAVESLLGAGTSLVLEVPLTLTIIPALTVGGAGMSFAVPRSAIDEIVRPGGAVRFEKVGGGLMVCVRGVRMPVVELGTVMGARPHADAQPPLLVLVRLSGGGRYALGVEVVHDHEELVIKPAAPAVMASGLFAGTTLPDNSRPMLLLDLGGVAAAAGVAPVMPGASELTPPAAAAPTLPTLLFRDVDGAERAVRLAAVERIDEVARTAVADLGGRSLLVHGGMLTPLHRVAPVPAQDRLRVMRLGHGRADLAYLVDQVLDIVEAALAMTPAAAPGAIAGVLVHEGRAIELLDTDWLLGALPAGRTDADPVQTAAPQRITAIAA